MCQHFYPFAVALPSAVLWFASLSSLEKDSLRLGTMVYPSFYPWKVVSDQHVFAAPSC